MNLLIVRIGAIGDVVMALAAVEAARALDPDARATWLCGELGRPLLEHVGTVDEIVAVDERALLTGTVRARTREIGRAWRALAGRRFDLVLTAHAVPRYRVLSATVRAGTRRSLRSWARGRPRSPAGTRATNTPGSCTESTDRTPSRRACRACRFRAETGCYPKTVPPSSSHRAGPRTSSVTTGSAAGRSRGTHASPLAHRARGARRRLCRPARRVGAPSFAALPVVDLVGRRIYRLGATIEACDLLITHAAGPCTWRSSFTR